VAALTPDIRHVIRRSWGGDKRSGYCTVFFNSVRPLCVAFTAAALAGGFVPVLAQSPKSLGTFDAWVAVELPEKSSKICYMASRPEKSAPDGAKRGDILLTVTHRPNAKQRDEVSFQSGYPYKPGAPVTIEIDKKKFELFTKPDSDPEGAWSRDAAMDKALVEAMRAGNSAVVKGTSSRGTETADTFSLAGFTKAYAEIGKACGIK
jgi:invasion protein IalB